MGSIAHNDASRKKSDLGNSSILTKVDKLRELIGTKVALPQLVVVGDQSSGKSSVLEGLTGFAFPRDAELCTRYATQITCRRENEESINVAIIPHADAAPDEQERVRKFHRTLREMTPESLAEVFKAANEAMGIRTSAKSKSHEASALPTFSEHILKIEKLGPEEQHFTVIDVPGIFRKETEGITTEADIDLVRNMVKTYMKDTRTIILAIMPSNVDPATQEILKLARQADPTMERTMAVLTKPDLAIERTMQQIAIDHVAGTRSDLVLGYYIVKNRGPDDADMTLQQGKEAERNFFSQSPWSTLRNTSKAGVDNLNRRVRELLVDLIRREFPKLKSEVMRELSSLRHQIDGMGAARSDPHTQRAYLNRIGEEFQAIARDALNAYYTGNKIFDERHDLRLITRVVKANEEYSKVMSKSGHTRSFVSNPDTDGNDEKSTEEPVALDFGEISEGDEYPELEGICDIPDTLVSDIRGEGIMEYIKDVYRDSRGQELGTFNPALLSTMFKEQSKKWEPITLSYVKGVIHAVHHFISEVVNRICPDPRVRDELWDGYLLEELRSSYQNAMNHTRFLLNIEREGIPITLNHYFNDNLQQSQSTRMLGLLQELGDERQNEIRDATGRVVNMESGIFLGKAGQQNLTRNIANSEHVRENIHDVLKSYYKVSRKRFVDVVCQQAVNYYLLSGKDSPLKKFCTEMVLNLNEDQLDMIAAEDAPVKLLREKLALDKQKFEAALKVLKGSG